MTEHPLDPHVRRTAVRPENASAALLGALSKLLTETAAAPLRLDVAGIEQTRAVQVALVDQLSDYILPRLVQLDAPVVVVVGGSTGAGKSTLVNSLIGERVSESGVLRPTTRSPVLVHHPADREWFLPDRVLPELPRTSDLANRVSALRVLPSDGVPAGIAILDAPDIDSIDEENRKLAGQLLAAADLWLFVTSAARYSDQVPWDYLRQAAERSTSVAVVLDRTPADAVNEVRGHLARMMTSRGLSDSPLFTVLESPTDHEGLLGPEVVAPILGWLKDIAADPLTRWAVMKRTLDGAIRFCVYRAHDIADALEVQSAMAEELYGVVDAVYRVAREGIGTAVADGSLLSGEFLSAWLDFEQAGDLVGLFERKRFRRRLTDGFSGRSQRATDLLATAGGAVLALSIVQAESAAEAVTKAWKELEAGAALLGPTRGLDRPSHDLRDRLQRVVSEWQTSLSNSILRVAESNRRLSQIADQNLEGLTAVLAAVALDNLGTAGVTARGRAALEGVIGQGRIAEIVTGARTRLVADIAEVLNGESQRFLDLTDSPENVRAAHDALRDAARRADYARHSEALDEELT